MDFERCGREATESDSSKRSREPKMARLASGSEHAFGDVGRGERGGEDFSGEVAGFVGVAFASASAAAELEGDVVFGEDVGQALDFADVRDGEENALAIGVEFLDFLAASSGPRRGSAGEGWVRSETSE